MSYPPLYPNGPAAAPPQVIAQNAGRLRMPEVDALMARTLEIYFDGMERAQRTPATPNAMQTAKLQWDTAWSMSTTLTVPIEEVHYAARRAFRSVAYEWSIIVQQTEGEWKDPLTVVTFPWEGRQ
jgi:hypothetical protein